MVHAQEVVHELVNLLLHPDLPAKICSKGAHGSDHGQHHAKASLMQHTMLTWPGTAQPTLQAQTR